MKNQLKLLIVTLLFTINFINEIRAVVYCYSAGGSVHCGMAGSCPDFDPCGCGVCCPCTIINNPTGVRDKLALIKKAKPEDAYKIIDTILFSITEIDSKIVGFNNKVFERKNDVNDIDVFIEKFDAYLNKILNHDFGKSNEFDLVLLKSTNKQLTELNNSGNSLNLIKDIVLISDDKGLHEVNTITNEKKLVIAKKHKSNVDFFQSNWLALLATLLAIIAIAFSFNVKSKR